MSTDRAARDEEMRHIGGRAGDLIHAQIEGHLPATPARVARYTVNPADRIREILGHDEIPDTAELTYSFDNGHEKLEYRSHPSHGGLHFSGSYHPGEGFCEGEGCCKWCGRTMW